MLKAQTNFVPVIKIQNIMKTIQSILFFFLALSIMSCGGKQSSNKSKLSGDIKIDGSSTVYPITEAVAEEFRASFPRVNITIGISGTGGGFQKFSRGEVDLANASREIKQKEKDLCKENNIEFIEMSVAYDGLAVLVNPQNDWVDNFSVEELKKIWEPDAQGKITRWNQIRPDWPDEEMHLYGPGIASGTYDYFTEAVVGKSGASRGDFTASEDDNVLVQGIAGDKYGLGFFGLAYYGENQDKLKLVAVNGGNGPVLPSVETVRNGSYSPLARPLYIYVNSIAATRPEVQELIKFYLENSATLSGEVGYVALEDEKYSEQKTKFKTFVSGLK